MCLLFCSLFQAHSAFRYVVMGANARRSSQTQNKIIVSKTELPVKKLNSSFLCNSVLLITLCYIEKGDSQFTSLAKIFVLRYVVIPFTVSAWSGTKSLLTALEAKQN